MCGLVAPAFSQHVLWQIGKFDDSSQEFRSQGIDCGDPRSNDDLPRLAKAAIRTGPVSSQDLPMQLQADASIRFRSTLRYRMSPKDSIMLTAMDTPATPQESMGNIAPGQSGIAYDALAFSCDEHAQYVSGSIHTLIVPTIFYKTSSAGLQEMVDAYPDFHAGAVPRGDADLTVNGTRLTQRLAFAGEFGEGHLRFAVPEWQGEAQATLNVAGHSFQQKLEAAKKWTLDIVPHEHLDIGFTDYAPKVAELQSQSVDRGAGSPEEATGLSLEPGWQLGRSAIP